nr:hypothetical protein Iba_chr04aCG7290 [Ipomoea batatas]
MEPPSNHEQLIEEQELLILPPEEKDSRLFGWKVEIRERANGCHDKPAGLQSNKVSSGKLSVEGKGKGILIEENVHSGKFSSKPYICANFQNPTIMRNAGWSMVGMNGTSFGSSNPNNHLANLQNDNQKWKPPSNHEQIEEQGIVDPCRQKRKDSRLFGWKVEIRERANGFCHDKESGGSPSPRGLLQPQLDIRRFCAQLNEALENERAGLITSLGGNKGKGIVIHEEPAGLQSNKVSSEKLSVEGKGKGILIEENVHSGKFSSKPYSCANFQNPTIMRNAGWSMVGMNGTSFGSSNPNDHLANLQNDNQVPVPHGVCTNTLPQNTMHHPCKTSVMQSFETNGQTLRANTSEKYILL